jgi:hypothetical protein
MVGKIATGEIVELPKSGRVRSGWWGDPSFEIREGKFSKTSCLHQYRRMSLLHDA